MILSRRSFFTGLGASLIAAPAIVRAASLMPVRALRLSDEEILNRFVDCVGHYPAFSDAMIYGLDVLYGTKHVPLDSFYLSSVETKSPYEHVLDLTGLRSPR